MATDARALEAVQDIDSPRLRVTVETVEWVRQHLGLSYSRIAGLIGADPSTVLRWVNLQNRPSDRHFRSVRELMRLRDLLETLFDDDTDRIQAWLYSPSGFLDDRLPEEVLTEEQKLEPVLQALTSLVTGQHS